MTLTNYWWLLIWLATAGGALALLVPRKPVDVMGTIEYRWNWIPAILLAVPYVIWATNRSWFGDTEVYRKTFSEIPSSISSLSVYLADHTKDKGFSVLMCLIKMIMGNSDKIFFFLIAAFQIFCIVYFFRKYSSSFMMSMFMFVASTDYLSWMFNGMRQFIAVCLVLLSFDLVLNKKSVPAIGIIIIASTIHGSAIIMLPIIFMVQGRAWNKKTLFLLASTSLVIVYIGRFTSILENILADTQYNDIISNEIWVGDNGTNILRVLFYSMPAVLSLIGKRYIDYEDSPVINMCVNCAACTSFLYLLSAFSSGIYIGRLPIYTTLPGYVAVPWIIDHMFNQESARLIKIIIIFIYLIFFYYQMHMAWGIL